MRLNFSGVRDSSALDILVITEILLDCGRYAEKYLWGWYIMQSPGAEKQLLLRPIVDIFWVWVGGEGSDEVNIQNVSESLIQYNAWTIL